MNVRPIYPPRPKGKISPASLPQYTNDRWVAQRKFNGQRVVIHAFDGEFQIFGRQIEKPKNFSLTPAILDELDTLDLQPDKEYWLDGELLDNKTTDPLYKNKIILFDVLQAGRYLFGHELQGRTQLLQNICRYPSKLEPAAGIALAVTEHIWFAETFTSNFVQEYNKFLHMKEIEGLVLKQPTSVLTNRGLQEYEVTWQLRCRKPTKNYNT